MHKINYDIIPKKFRNCGSLILAIGKRKRSNTEIIAGSCRQGTSNIKSMDIDVASSSSSISSSESEAGIFTNDEGREGTANTN